MHLQKIMNRAVENPLHIYLPFPTKGESIQPQYGTDMGKWTFSCPESSIVNQATSYRIDLAFHLLCERLRLRLRTPLEKVHLSCFSTVRMSQASLP